MLYFMIESSSNSFNKCNVLGCIFGCCCMNSPVEICMLGDYVSNISEDAVVKGTYSLACEEPFVMDLMDCYMG